MGSKRTARKRQKPEIRYELTYKNALSDDILAEAATFYSQHYGISSAQGASPGTPVPITPAQLKQNLWPSTVQSWQDQALIQAYLGDEDDPSTMLIGQLFVTKWTWEQRRVLWITHLCVHSDHRRQGVAGKLVGQIVEEAPVWYEESAGWVVGVTTAHPATLVAAVKGLGNQGPDGLKVVLEKAYTAEQVKSIIRCSPVEALRSGKLKDGPAGEEDLVGPHILDTGFFVENAEGSDMARRLRESGLLLPTLPSGCEYILAFDGI